MRKYLLRDEIGVYYAIRACPLREMIKLYSYVRLNELTFVTIN